MKLQALILLCFLPYLINAQETCTASVSGDQALRSLSWSCTGGASPPNASGTYNLNIVINGLGNGEELIIDRDYFFLGDFTINASGSNPTLVVNSGNTLKVDGDINNDDNNLRYRVDGTLRVSGTIEGKNNHVFSGSGEIYAYTIDLGSNATFGAPTPNLYVYDCDAQASFCNASNVSTEPSTFDPLPVELIKFEAMAVDNKVKLLWITASELNNDFFDIERSVDGKNFQTIGSVMGNGTTNELNEYEYIDNQFNSGKSYYRLRQTDFNGNFELSKVVIANQNESVLNDFELYPNPTNNGQFYLKLPVSSDFKIFLTDLVGKEILIDLKTTDFDSFTLVKINFSKFLPSGIFTVNVFFDGKMNHKKLVVR